VRAIRAWVSQPLLSRRNWFFCGQALSMGDTDYFAVFCTQQQHQWLEAQSHDGGLDAARLTDLLLGSLVDGRRLAAETYGCMQPFCQVPGHVPALSLIGWICSQCCARCLSRTCCHSVELLWTAIG